VKNFANFLRIKFETFEELFHFNSLNQQLVNLVDRRSAAGLSPVSFAKFHTSDTAD